MKKRSFLQSLNDAAEGFVYVVRHERNMRVHFMLAFLVLVFAAFIGISRVEWVLLCTAVTFVLAAEMINTVVEDITDLVKGTFHPAARIIKDISAGMVLVSALNAALAGFFIFSRHLVWPFEAAAIRIHNAPRHVTFLALLAVVFVVIAAKAFLHRGTPFKGGAVSGHTAVSFCLWTALLFTGASAFTLGIAFLLALLVAQSRLRAKIHSLAEVAAGAALGVLLTALFFLVLR